LPNIVFQIGVSPLLDETLWSARSTRNNAILITIQIRNLASGGGTWIGKYWFIICWSDVHTKCCANPIISKSRQM
jgi:hypothetical protein